MKVKIQIIIESDNDTAPVIQEIAQFERKSLQAENLGISLTEAKALLRNTQEELVHQQISEYERQHSKCLQCGSKLRHKDRRKITYRTVFSKLKIPAARLFNCQCIEQKSRSFSPLVNLLTSRTSPELLYLESKFASLVSYGLTVDFLEELLPVGGEISTTAVRNNLHISAKRFEDELGEEKRVYIEGCQRDWDKLPQPDLPLVVGMDGGYVRFYNKKSNTKGNFEVIVGKSIKNDKTAKLFGGVYKYDTKPQRRLFNVLEAQGMQMNQQVTFLSDGDEKLRELMFGLNPNTEYLLDWFHMTMRLTVLNQMSKGICKKTLSLETDIPSELERIKWYLWHGNVFRALQILKEQVDDLEMVIFEGNKPSEVKKLFRAMRDFETYIYRNEAYIPNFGERWRNNEAISTGFVESTVNRVISKRFVKKQQMRWTQVGAHLLLQMRILVLNEELAHQFQQWYPGLKLDQKSNNKTPQPVFISG
ncbi:MAG: ISKra4 family transposase ISSysp6 (plasmid) [Chroococcopsis gigantea SAG 12.99]|jgi:hypothetical protein|nr:ISKra4 family transposase ISSysp6 [Chroococcopsis gigantea SAG 12.99]